MLVPDIPRIRHSMCREEHFDTPGKLKRIIPVHKTGKDRPGPALVPGDNRYEFIISIFLHPAYHPVDRPPLTI